jgi:simple sugar transport system substrate-binding protein
MLHFKRLLLVSLLLTGVLLVGVGAAGAQDSQLKFRMVSHGGPGNPFWTVVIKGMEDSCALLKADCLWLGDDKFSLDKMPGLWEDAIASNPNGIGTTVPDSEILRPAVTKAHDLGIPVIAFNTADKGAGTDKALPILFYIGANERSGGVSNARRVFDQAKADGKTIKRGVCTIQEQGHSGLEARCAGVKSVFDDQGVPLDILNINNDPKDSAGKIADYFTKNPDTNAIFMLGPLPSSALNLYIQDKGIKAGELYATTHDTSAEIYQMIKDGYLLQAIDQQPYLQGFETIQWLYLNSQYKLAPGGDIFTGPGVIDKSNVDAIVDLTAKGYR